LEGPDDWRCLLGLEPRATNVIDPYYYYYNYYYDID